MIGLKGLRVPDTTLSRSIIIELQRKLPSDVVTDFDHLDKPALAGIRRKLARYARDHGARLGEARPAQPAGFFNRVAANWRLMLAIADHCGAGDRARAAAVKLSRRGDDSSLGVELLKDVRDTFERLRTDRISSEQLTNELANMLDRPWSEMPKNGKRITQLGLAQMLRGFYIKPKQVRFDEIGLKGYRLDQFKAAFRYIPAADEWENTRNSETMAEYGQKVATLPRSMFRKKRQLTAKFRCFA